MCVGWPAETGALSPRLPLTTTLQRDRHADGDFAAEVEAYDRRRAAIRPYRRQRDPARFGEAPFYGWSHDKARQYAEPLRADSGAFVRAKGFRLE
jgi:nitroreductase/FMN reductase [NAD(P)H]